MRNLQDLSGALMSCDQGLAAKSLLAQEELPQPGKHAASAGRSERRFGNAPSSDGKLQSLSFANLVARLQRKEKHV